MEKYFATCPKSLEGLLLNELTGLGAQQCKETVAGVHFETDLAGMYKICLHSRFANRVLFPLSSGDAQSSEQLYATARNIPWMFHFDAKSTFIIDFVGSNDAVRHTQYGAQLVKDAVVDYFSETVGFRPSVSKDNPDIRINVRLAKNKAHISLDCSGESLHRRGYRRAQGAAPLKENLAAGILSRTNWKAISEQGGFLIDPMCGSGTFLVEAALMALDIAPGIYRKGFGFERLNNFDHDTWQAIWQSAQRKKNKAIESSTLEIRGYDVNPKVLDAAQTNVDCAGLGKVIKLLKKPLQEFVKPTHRAMDHGLMITNPPYGERLGDVQALRQDYRVLGRIAKEQLPGWEMAVFTGNVDLGKELRLRPKKTYKFFNGAIASQLLLFDLVGSDKKLREDLNEAGLKTPLSEGAQMVYNRLGKNAKKYAKWRKNESIECYRIYDADIPEYAAAIDVYGHDIHIQEYQAPKNVEEQKAQRRLDELVHACAQFFDVGFDQISVKVRKRNRGKEQYEKQEDGVNSRTLVVTEGAAKLEVNLTDYLDTGLFLDHRPLRRKIFETASGKKFLNLFCYTASATVHAALGGASHSVSVDMSNTYLEWAKRNFSLNNISETNHQLVREDCFQYLDNCREGFDVIMLDPPSFSNSKKMEGVLDVQRDHVKLIQRCVELLAPKGVLYFSTNLRSFKIDEQLESRFNVRDISLQTLDPDFKARPKIHYCWEIKAE